MRHLWRPGIKTFGRILSLLEANYPETMGMSLSTLCGFNIHTWDKYQYIKININILKSISTC